MSKLRFVVLDEADQLLEMGFRPDVERYERGPTRSILPSETMTLPNRRNTAL